MKYAAALFGLIVLACVGVGCQAPIDSSTRSSGVQRVDVASKRPEEVTQLLRLLPPVTIRAELNFDPASHLLATERGFGATGTATFVVTEYAPKKTARMDWKFDTDLPSKRGSVHHQYIGNLIEVQFANTADIFPPILWQEGIERAHGTAGIWVSSDVYENIAKSGQSTLLFGMTNFEHALGLAPKFPRTALAMQALKDAMEKTHPGDPTLGKREEQKVEVSLTVNGKVTTVLAWRVQSWFGEMDILANETNPLILRVAPSAKLPRKDLWGLFGYRVTEIEGLNQPL